MRGKLTAANAVTALRLVLSAVMAFLRPLTAAFYVLYFLCGVSDMTDGLIARRTGTASPFGAGLDTAADAVFVAAAAVRLVPALGFSPWVIICAAVVLAVKLASQIISIVKCRRLCAVHSAANKTVGVLLFLLPLTHIFFNVNVASLPVIAGALFAAVQELGYVIKASKSAV